MSTGNHLKVVFIACLPALIFSLDWITFHLSSLLSHSPSLIFGINVVALELNTEKKSEIPSLNLGVIGGGRKQSKRIFFHCSSGLDVELPHFCVHFASISFMLLCDIFSVAYTTQGSLRLCVHFLTYTRTFSSNAL